MQQPKHPEIKALSILHIALLVGQVLFTLIAFYIAYSRDFSSHSPLQSYSNELILLCIVLGISGYFGGNILFRKKLDTINENSLSLSNKFNDYRGALIVRWAMLEFPILFCIILFFVTNNSTLLMIGCAFILLFLTTRPTLQKVASDLRVSEEEI